MSTVLIPALDTPLCIPELGPRRRDAALLELARCALGASRAHDAALLHGTLVTRERFGSTSPGRGLALPNARSLHVSEPRMIVARSRRGIDWSAPDEQPVHLVVLVASPAETSVEAHHALLGRAYAAVRLARQRQRLLEAEDAAAMLRRLMEALA